MILKISSEADKRAIAAILVANGYTVKIVKVKMGKLYQRVMSVEENEEE